MKIKWGRSMIVVGVAAVVIGAGMHLQYSQVKASALLSDISGHWGNASIEQAVASGYVETLFRDPDRSGRMD